MVMMGRDAGPQLFVHPVLPLTLVAHWCALQVLGFGKQEAHLKGLC